MLQEYPTQIQPRSSSTRGTQDSLHQESDSSNKVDAEASRILIDLANQGNDNLNTNNDMITSIKKTKAKSTENQSYLQQQQQQQQQSDPIMLLAAAAAVIDNESNKYYKGRFYERREIKLYSRQQGSQKRKSYTYGINDDSHNTNESLFHRRHSEKRHRYQRSSISAQQPEDTWLPSREESKGGHKEDSQHSFSWQFLSMKQNPRIKRNAMHAYITYMIYTDMAQEQQQRQYKKSDNNITYNSNSTIQHHFPSSAPPPPTTTITTSITNTTNTITTNDWFNNNSHHRSAPTPAPLPPPPPPTATQPSSNTSLTMQSYRLPPSPRQKRHESPPTESIIGRPLTDFLFQGKNSNRSVNNHILPLPPPPQ
ncbi:MAG: hypothetical protein EXX96DRAFT_283988 [Benjaminiella poitrasii]|nr:MAG: hypothetical protein EXX96DRAFT_283988 [Benjaminiella poitrasii]